MTARRFVFLSAMLMFFTTSQAYNPPVKGRSLSSVECAHMARVLPEAARYLSTVSWSEQNAVDHRTLFDFPEATHAMVVWLASYKLESLANYGYEMSIEFKKVCDKGKIYTIPVRESR